MKTLEKKISVIKKQPIDMQCDEDSSCQMIINCSRADADTENQRPDVVVTKNGNQSCSSSSDIEPSVRVSKGSSDRNKDASGEDGEREGSPTLELMTGGTPEWRVEGDEEEEKKD